MAIGRYLSSDTGDSLRKFGSSIGDIAGGLASYEDSRRAREIQEMREKRYRDEEKRLQANQRFTIGKALAAESDPVARHALSRIVPQDIRRDIGYTPIEGTGVPASDFTVAPPTAAGPRARPTTISTPARPAIERDPFGGVSRERMITYRGAEWPEDEYLALRRQESEAAYSGAPSGSTRDFRPTTTDIMRVIDGILTRENNMGVTEVLVPASERAGLIARARENELSLTEAKEAADSLLAAHRPQDVPADTSSMLGPPAEEGPGILGRVGRWLGIIDDEPEPAEQPTVRYPWPRPEEFAERQPEGMWGAPDDAPLGSLEGPGDPDAPIDPAAAGATLTQEDRDMIRAALDRGMSVRDVAQYIVDDLGVDEATAQALVRSAR